MPMQLHSREVDRVLLVEAVGRFTLTDGRTMLRDLLHVSTAAGARKFVLVLARVEFIDSYGIGELVRSYSVVRQMGGDLKLADVSQKVLQTLEISGLHRIFEIFPAEDAALRAFR